MKTVIFVRHADIDIPPSAPDELIALNAAGRARAAELARVAGAAGVTAVFTSTAERTKQTAAPLAAALGLAPQAVPASPAGFVAAVRSAAVGPVVLVVGHSNTVPQMIAALGAAFPGPPIQGFDDLFVLTAGEPDQAAVVRLRYGAGATPPRGPLFTDPAGRTVAGAAVAFAGELFGGKEKLLTAVSGGDVVGDLLVLASDEMKGSTFVQLLRRQGAGYVAAGVVPLPAGDDEVDVEGVAADRATGTVYVTGSHCRARKIDGADIGKVKPKASREQFFRFKLHPDGTAGDAEGPRSLMPAIAGHPVLQPFTLGASKENGVDVEGLAVQGGRLHFGFRGPVLRHGWVPVLSCTWDDPEHTAEVRYLRLGGRGVRDLAAVAGGFLVLAGPVGDGDPSYRVYFWDGADHLPAGDAGPGPRLLGEFSGLAGGKPEGLVVLGEGDQGYDVLLLCDGLPRGGPTRWSLPRP